MNYTENYQLNQWEPADRVLRTDFNEDNRKIEEALQKSEDARFYIKLLEITTTTTTKEINLDVSSIDLLQYHKIELYVSCPTKENGFTLQVNHLSSEYPYTSISGGGASSTRYTDCLAYFPSGSQGLLFFYPPATNSKIGCFYAYSTGSGYSGYQVLAPCTWEECKTLNCISETTFSACTHVRLLGVKK